MRNALLVDLANEGEKAASVVQAKVGELLARPPGLWLPDGFEAGYQLLDLAIEEANKEGKQVLFKAARRILNELGRTWTFQALNTEQGRQILGAAMLVASHPTFLPNHDIGLAVPLQIARKVPELFWSRVPVPEEIVGRLPEHKGRMLDYLWSQLPVRIRELLDSSDKISNKLCSERVEILTRKLQEQRVKKNSYLRNNGLLLREIAKNEPVVFKLNISQKKSKITKWMLCRSIAGHSYIARISSALEKLNSALSLVAPGSQIPVDELPRYNFEVSLANPTEHELVNLIRPRIDRLAYELTNERWPIRVA